MIERSCCGSVDKTTYSQLWGPQFESAGSSSSTLGQGTLSSLPSPLERTWSRWSPGCLFSSSLLSGQVLKTSIPILYDMIAWINCKLMIIYMYDRFFGVTTTIMVKVITSFSLPIHSLFFVCLQLWPFFFSLPPSREWGDNDQLRWGGDPGQWHQWWWGGAGWSS